MVDVISSRESKDESPVEERVFKYFKLRKKLLRWRVISIILIIGIIISFFANVSKRQIEDHVAVVSIDGAVDENAQWFRSLKTISTSRHVKAVLLKIDCHGGPATDSEILFQLIRLISKKKPVVSSIHNIGASGGYLAAIAADHVTAYYTSMIGSIGVITQYLEYSQLMDKLGIGVVQIKSGSLKAAMSPFEKLSPGDRVELQKFSDDIHQWFMMKVVERRHLYTQTVQRLSDGRTFTGNHALQYGLIDQLGGDQSAINWLYENRKVSKDLPFIVYYNQSPFAETLRHLKPLVTASLASAINYLPRVSSYLSMQNQ